jgi:hypothetical protein
VHDLFIFHSQGTARDRRVVFLGNIIVTAWWKMAADRTRDPPTIAYAQRQPSQISFSRPLAQH